MKIQISFLGKARQDTKTGYRTANYCFQDGQIVTTAFFGPELARKVQPDKLYILGTAGSMWDMLLSSFGADTVDDNDVLALWQQAQDETVNEALLASFEQMLSEKLGIACCLRVISYARDEPEQAALLARLAEWVSKGDELVLDVTHGLRHLPMLMLAAAHYLERVRGVKVQDIYYGALEMSARSDNSSLIETPVLSLKGMLRLLDWVQALAADASSGNYGVFQPLLESSGMAAEISQCLAEAAHFERITNPVKAREKLAITQQSLEQLDDPLATLFRDELISRTDWWRKGERGDWEARLAWRWFERGDYLRAVIYAQEALISMSVAENAINDFGARDDAKIKLRENGQANRLFALRNALAHGIRPENKDLNKMLGDEKTLRSTLKGMMKDLLGSA